MTSAAFEYRGIIEGFYGPQWTLEDRLDMIDFMTKFNLNTYIYAPKTDPYHRGQWKVPYPQADMERLSKLVSGCSSQGVNFVFAVSPGLTLTYSSDADLDSLWAKYLPFLEQGVTSLGLFFDDIPFDLIHGDDVDHYEHLAEAQVAFTHRLLEKMDAYKPGLTLIICPTLYHGDGNSPYLQYLGEHLAGRVEIMWTGPAVCSSCITHHYASSIAKTLRRPPLLWDNYPVNDALMVSELHLGPYQGRDQRLHEVVRGICLNPMIQPEASKIPIATAGIYMMDPDAYEPEAAWMKAAEDIVGADMLPYFGTFAESNTVSCLQPGDPPALVELFERFERLTNSFQFEDGFRELHEYVDEMIEAGEQLEGFADSSRLGREIQPWLNEYLAWADYLTLGAQIMTNLVQAMFTDDRRKQGLLIHAVSDSREHLRQCLKDSIDFRTKTCGNAIRNFLIDILNRSYFLVEGLQEAKKKQN